MSVKFDDAALSQLIDFRSAPVVDPTALTLWMGLPANQYIIHIGQVEGNLTPEQLREIAVSTSPRSAELFDMDNLNVPDPARYRRQLTVLQRSYRSRAASIAHYVLGFCPPATHATCTVYLHLGGDWDGVNSNGNIYVNARFWLDNPTQTWEGLDMVVSHELMHTIQNQAYGNPERQDSSIPAFVTALSKIQREGTARYVEYEAEPNAYTKDSYGFEYRAIDSEQRRAFKSDVTYLDGLYAACFPTFDHAAFTTAFQAGVAGGGPYYDIGDGIAAAIDRYDGRGELVRTVSGGPKIFFQDYLRLTEKYPALPKISKSVADEISRMPAKL